MRPLGLCGSYRISQSLPVALALTEPITTVLLSPLLVDLYSRPEVILSCNKHYVLFVDCVFVITTICSLLAVAFCMSNIIRLSPRTNKDIVKNLKSAFVITSVLNLVMTWTFLSGISRDEPSDEMDDESCQYWSMKQMARSIGLKSLIPQVVMCITILLSSTFLCLNRLKTGISEEGKDSSNQNIAKDIVLPLLSTLLFQVFYFILRLSMSRCTCGWFTLLSRRMGSTLELCWIKSMFVVSSQILCTFYLRRREQSHLFNGHHHQTNS
ncbi:uncharacterized protein LOC124134093 [Haliotis rufescens]|uniref:uncharacterized protein LOC124134093 n=1 Tax=Haliotis rufescens TaxID=6454 RepID=UPI00201EC17F|nr:uncharacterized protein LOC124134093 [Haliotis rufescens]XP_046354695.2 uncharacterized protein LOC124134093 [Haliotis rufescens]XP_046354696.2 uncharacterized protein LOC124134093 [Haliotis rufescens]